MGGSELKATVSLFFKAENIIAAIPFKYRTPKRQARQNPQRQEKKT